MLDLMSMLPDMPTRADRIEDERSRTIPTLKDCNDLAHVERGWGQRRRRCDDDNDDDDSGAIDTPSSDAYEKSSCP